MSKDALKSSVDGDSTDVSPGRPKALRQEYFDENQSEPDDDFDISEGEPFEDGVGDSSEDSDDLGLVFEDDLDFLGGMSQDSAQDKDEEELSRMLIENAMMWGSPDEDQEVLKSELEAEKKVLEKRVEYLKEKKKECVEAALKGGLKEIEEDLWANIFKSYEKKFDDKAGLMKVELEIEDGKSISNFLDGKNQVVYPDEWFKKADVFKLRPFKTLEFLAINNEPVSLVETEEGLKFLTPYGELLGADADDIVIYKKTKDEMEKDDGWGDIHVEIVAKKEDPLEYIDSLTRQMTAFAKRLPPKGSVAFTALLAEIEATKKSSNAKSDWMDVLMALKNKVEFSDLNKGNKTLFIFELWQKANRCEMDTDHASRLFPDIPRQVTREGKALVADNLFSHIQYSNGIVIGIADKKTKSTRYFIIHNEAWMHFDEPFDRVSPFIGMLAMVKRGGKYNFLREDSGTLLLNEWLSEEPVNENGVFIIRDKGEVKYLNSKDGSYFSSNSPKIFFMRTRRFVQSFFRSKETGKDLPYGIDDEWSFEADEERQPEVLKRSINKAAHHGFQQLLLAAETHQESIRLLRLSNAIIEVLNKEGNAGKISSTLTQLQLTNFIIKSKLHWKKREEIADFVRNLQDGNKYEWKEVTPLPINFLMVYKGLIENFNGEYLEKAALMGLFIKMESELNWLPNKKEDFRKLLPKYREAIGKAKIPSKTKEKIKLVLNELVSHIDFNQVDLRAEFSMIAFLHNLKKKKASKRRKSQEIQTEPEEIRVDKSRPEPKPTAPKRADDTTGVKPRKIPEGKIVTQRIERSKRVVKSRSRIKSVLVAGAVFAGAAIVLTPTYLYLSYDKRKYEQAMEYMREGDRKNLKEAVKVVDEIHLDDDEHLLQQAEMHLSLAEKKQSHYGDAASCYERIISNGSEDLEIQRLLFEAHKNLGQDLQGLETFVEAEEMESEYLIILIDEYKAIKKANEKKGRLKKRALKNVYKNTLNELSANLMVGEDNPEILYEMARRHEWLGGTGKAKNMYLAGASEYPDYKPNFEAIARFQNK